MINAKQIEQRLEELLNVGSPAVQPLLEAASYAVFTGGKRLRPLLTLAVAEALGSRDALDAACAVEMLHVSSLIHDDMPCMDNDDFRRGQPTVHRAFGEYQALLAGDFLLVYAFEVVTKSSLPPPVQAEIVRVLARSAGAEGMCGGQLLDLNGNIDSIDQLESMYELKTGALLNAAVQVGAIVAGAHQEERALLEAYAQKVGLAFQIIDDVLDVVAPEVKHKTSSDQVNQKQTYVTFVGLEQCRVRAHQLIEEALVLLTSFGKRADPLRELAHFIEQRAT